MGLLEPGNNKELTDRIYVEIVGETIVPLNVYQETKLYRDQTGVQLYGVILTKNGVTILQKSAIIASDT